MAKIKRSWDLISEGTRKTAIESVMRFAQEEMDQDMGRIMAEGVLDALLPVVVNDIYNKGVEDSEKLLEARLMDLKMDMNVLMKG